MAYEAKVNYTDVLGSVKYWDILIHNYLMDKGIVVDSGNHEQLLEKSQTYKNFYDKQISKN